MAYPTRYLQCRGARNCWWKTYIPEPGEFKRAQYGSRWVQQCQNCHGFRHRLVNRITGAVLSQWVYRRPPGYAASIPMDAQDFRRKLLAAESKKLKLKAK